MDAEYMVQLQDSKERTVMSINEVAEMLNKLDPCSEDYAHLVDRQKELLTVLDKMVDEEQKIIGIDKAEDAKTAELAEIEAERLRREEERKKQFRADVAKICISGTFSLAGIYLLEAFQAGGWIIKSPAMQWVPKPKI